MLSKKIFFTYFTFRTTVRRRDANSAVFGRTANGPEADLTARNDIHFALVTVRRGVSLQKCTINMVH